MRRTLRHLPQLPERQLAGFDNLPESINDIDTQAIIRKARMFNKAGERTAEIITTPHLINAGTEDWSKAAAVAVRIRSAHDHPV